MPYSQPILHKLQLSSIHPLIPLPRNPGPTFGVSWAGGEILYHVPDCIRLHSAIHLLSCIVPSNGSGDWDDSFCYSISGVDLGLVMRLLFIVIIHRRPAGRIYVDI